MFMIISRKPWHYKKQDNWCNLLDFVHWAEMSSNNVMATFRSVDVASHESSQNVLNAITSCWQ
jgi:hypothetical protein